MALEKGYMYAGGPEGGAKWDGKKGDDADCRMLFV